jgi:hypothetical protein
MANTTRAALLLLTGAALGVAGMVISGLRRVEPLSLP